MNHPRQTRTATPALAWLLGALCLSWLPGALPADVAFERETVMVETTKGSFPFRVEVARTPPSWDGDSCTETASRPTRA